jgi:hypothetical protein
MLLHHSSCSKKAQIEPILLTYACASKANSCRGSCWLIIGLCLAKGRKAIPHSPNGFVHSLAKGKVSTCLCTYTLQEQSQWRELRDLEV